MSSVDPNSANRDPGVAGEKASGLPIRWAVIAIVAAAASVLGYTVGGPMAAIAAGATVATAVHRLLA